MRFIATRAFVVAAVCLSPAAAGAATMNCAPASSPLLEVIWYVYAAPPLPSVPARVGRTGIVLCKDRRLFGWSTLNDDPAPALPFFAFLTVGTAAPDSLAALQKAMVAARIGLLRDCTIGYSLEEEDHLEVTWFGRDQRRNTFRLEGAAAAPVCSAEAMSFFAALKHLGFAPGATALEVE